MKKKFLATLLLAGSLILTSCGDIDIKKIASAIVDEGSSSAQVSSGESDTAISSDPTFSDEGEASSTNQPISSNQPSDESSQPADSSSASSSASSSVAAIDYVSDGSVKLTQEYSGHEFLTDGIGQVTLMTPIDGDTAHFKNANGGGDTIKIRFYGIDTPESTGNVEPYGKQASNFTKEKLNAASSNGTIVISSTFTEYKAPDPDSTGSRYLGLVWISLDKKNAPKEDLVLLNLWIVQEGLSYTKNVAAIPQYVDTFYAAEAQAEVLKLKMWSGEDDPYYNYGDYEDVSLLDVKKELEICFADSTHKNKYDNKKIRFTGTVVGYSNNILYVQEFYPYDDTDLSKGGDYAGINIFTGMKAIPSKYTKVNTYLEICGLAQDSENFGFQVTDTESHFPRVGSSSDADTQIILKAEDNTEEHSLYTFEKTAAEVTNWAKGNDLTALFCFVKVTTQVTIKSFYINASNEITLQVEGESWNIFIAFTYYGDPNDSSQVWKEESLFVGKTFTIQGVYAFHKTTSGKINYQLIPSKSADLVYIA